VNAIKLAADFVSRLPRDTLSPETTEEREGFVHPTRVQGEIHRCSVHFIVRDFEEGKLAVHEQLLRTLAADVVEGIAYASADVEVRRQYRNMKEYLKGHPRILEAAEEAIRRAGLEPKRSLIRGGTDGAMLSEKGLPTPNLFTGGHEYHSLREWICVHDMGAAVATIVHLAQIWAE